ncbi:hypothetical protein E5288_WYG004258 [Bos mutus]|uniref:Uncharacterized protein n=1 Tax=Bos mutus TaxID=72004 RepID=A0A6B0R4G1_9CETA|nr:hypothetical protein [Bos mutus]
MGKFELLRIITPVGMVMTVAAMFHQLVNIDIASEDADTLPQNRKSWPSRGRSDSDRGILTAAGIKFPKCSGWLPLLDTGTCPYLSFRRIQFVRNSSDKSQGYFKGKQSSKES